MRLPCLAAGSTELFLDGPPGDNRLFPTSSYYNRPSGSFMSKNFTRYHSIPLLLALVILVTAVPATAGPAAALGSLNNSRTDTSETSKVSGIDDGYGSRLLFSSTAVMYNPGEVEVSVVGLGLPQAAVGITRSFSLEAGLTVAPGWFGEMFFATPKFQVWSKGPWNLAIDAQTVLATD